MPDTQHGLAVQLVSDADAGHEDILRRSTGGAVVAVQTRERHAAFEREGAGREVAGIHRRWPE